MWLLRWNDKIKSGLRCFEANFTFVIAFYIMVLIKSAMSSPTAMDSPDSLQKRQEITDNYRKIYKQTSVLEKSFTFTGKVIYFPFRIIFSGVKYSIVFIDDSKIIPRTQDLLKSEDGKREVQPTYVSRIGVGLKYYHREIFNPESRLKLLAMFGLHSKQRYAVALERVAVGDLIDFSNYRALYEQLTTEPFYGIGPEAEKDDKSTYTREFFGADISLGKNLFRFGALQLYTGFHLNNILPGRGSEYPSTTDIYTPEELPGLGERVDLVKFEIAFSSDSRNRQGNPTKGLESEFALSYFYQTNASKYRFTKFFGDIKYYLHLFYGRTVMFRIRAESSDAISGSMIPFYYLSELSEDISFRGFDRGRFRDRDLLMGSVEYRYPLSRNFEGALFLDTGQVFPDVFRKVDWGRWELAGGIGLRYVTEGGSVSKIELARSKDGFLLKITLN
jgi:hypothetical protein